MLVLRRGHFNLTEERTHPVRLVTLISKTCGASSLVSTSVFTFKKAMLTELDTRSQTFFKG